MEQRTRKARGSSQRSYPASNKSPMPTVWGAHTNEELPAEFTSLLGFVVEVTTREGVLYEGVLTAVSPDVDVILKLAYVKTGKLSRDNVQESLKLKFCDIVTMVAKVTSNPSMEQKEDLRLDRDISSSTGSSAARELQPFTDFEETGSAAVNLGLDGSGWRPEEMWRENEEKFNVQSTFDDTLIQYTTPLERPDTEEFRKKEARAERLASEIENKQDWPALNDNFESTEEERFSAVLGPQSYMNLGSQASSSGTNSKLSEISCVGKEVPVGKLGSTGTQSQIVQHVEPAVVPDVATSSGPQEPQVNGGENCVHGKEGEEDHKNKEEVIRAFQLNPSAKEFTPSVSSKEFTPLVAELVMQSPAIPPPSQSPQAFYSPNKGRFSNFQKPRPRPFFSPDSGMPPAPTGYIYQNPSVSLSPQSLVRPFVPGSVVMPGSPYAMSGIVSPQQLMSGKMMEFVPPQVITMGQVASQPQHYIGPLGQPYSTTPQMIQANQQMFYMPTMQQGTVPSFVPTQPVMPQFVMLPRK